MLVRDDFSLLSRDSVKTIRKGLEGGVASGYGLFFVAAGFSLEHVYYESWLIAVGAAACAYMGKNLASSTRIAQQALEPVLHIEEDNSTNANVPQVSEADKVPN